MTVDFPSRSDGTSVFQVCWDLFVEIVGDSWGGLLLFCIKIKKAQAHN